jgi:hypothetical protein
MTYIGRSPHDLKMLPLSDARSALSATQWRPSPGNDTFGGPPAGCSRIFPEESQVIAAK